jgi:hypothetical protein
MAIGWKLIVTTAVAVGIPCFVLAENSASPKAPPAAVQNDANDNAAPAADREPGERGPGGPGPREEMRRFHEPKLEKGAFLGIATRPLSEEMYAQLKLPEGTGLLIDRVEDDSPAAKAGLKKFDVLTKVDDQLIINREQLEVLIRMHKANDEVKLGIIHEASAATVLATLVEKDLPPLEHGRPGPGGPEEGRPGAMGPMGGFMHGMHRGMRMPGGMGMGMGMPGMGMPGMGMGGMGMQGRDGMRGGMGGPDGMRGEMGGRDGMRGEMGGPPGMFGWGMRGQRGEPGMGRGPEAGPDGQNGPEDGPDDPDNQGPPHGRFFRWHGSGQGAPSTQPAPPTGKQP